MQICPFCASENIFFSKKRSKYYCEDCEKGFDTPSATQGIRIFLSYGHDKNAKVVKRIKEYLVAQGYDVWIDTSEIPPGNDWRERITNGLIGSNGVISFLSKHSVRDPGVCLDELKIAVCLKHAYIKTILLENESEVVPPTMVRNTQWIDMSNWDSVADEEWDDYFHQKMTLLLDALNSNEALTFNEELEFLQQQLGCVNDNTAKEQRLLKQVFVGRRWLTERVDSWSSSPFQDPFMIYGVPGSGKSAFSANLAQFNPSVLASLFFEWDHAELHHVDTVIKTLAFKLAATLPDYRRLLCNICKDNEQKKHLEQYRGAALFDYIILNPIQCCIDGDRRTGIILFDGLDETAPEIADLLIRKATQFPGWVKVLFTSRFDETTAPLFTPANTVMLDHALDNNTSDIKEYLACRLALDIEDKTVRRLASKCEGSFMYAASFCNAVDNGSMSLDDAETIPSGLNNFYYSFFKRLFKTRESFLEIRPFLELLCTNEDVPEDVITDRLQLDHYGLWELRLNVKNLVTNVTSVCGSGNAYQFKAIKFIHQSIKDWLLSPQLSGEYFVDVTNGYRQLAKYSEKMSALPEPSVNSSSSLYQKLQALNAKKLSNAQLEELQKEIERDRAANEERLKKQIHQKALRSYANNNYIKWLILGGKCDQAKDHLLSSFSPEEFDKKHSFSDYLAYYDLFNLWQWADLFPLDFPIDDLIEKFKEIAIYPKKYLVSRYAHRSLQVVFLTLRYIMDSGRYKDAFFSVMQATNFAGYFTSRASDDGETRDGWDKYYMTRDAVICLKKLDRMGIPVPDAVRVSCEKMKLTYNFAGGSPDDGMFYGYSKNHWSYGILSEPELFKDICILNDPQTMIGTADINTLLSHYNTTSLRFYLVNSDEEDLSFIKQCTQHQADLSAACRQAIQDIQNNPVFSHDEAICPNRFSCRLAFIRSLL